VVGEDLLGEVVVRAPGGGGVPSQRASKERKVMFLAI